MNLVIVESPTKAKTISKFLGSGFMVKSSFGHVRDLPKSKLSIDVKHNFKPKYIIPAKAKKTIAELKDAVEKSDEVIYATDEDREGEAIAWHLTQALEQDLKTAKRIVFHEITKHAIDRALQNPRAIDMNLVDAQQARRVLDRLVGYELSPFLWKKIRSGLSAGRVQSVAVRIVVEREREIQNFVKAEYWTVEVDLSQDSPTDGEEKVFRARLVKIGDKVVAKLDIKNAAEAKKIVSALEGAKYQVADISKKAVTRTPAPPFTTSTLQQEASRKFGLSAKQTMMLAQRLYETGLITYMRTDSVNLSELALTQAPKVIANLFGKEYCLDKPRFYSNKSKGAQEAHEAIRPTDLALMAEKLGAKLDPGQRKIYDIIWKRTLASQMQPAVFDQTSVDILASQDSQSTAELSHRQKGKSNLGMGMAQRSAVGLNFGTGTATAVFRSNGQVVKFDGFIRAYTEGKDENGDEEREEDSIAEKTGLLPILSMHEILNLVKLYHLQHFTEPPPRYTDATLVKALEAHGVGRPSTYAPTLATIQDRGYVEKIEKKYHPTEIGFLVNDMLVENFPEIIDINFTSHIEEELDDIAEGKVKWVPVIEEFYTPFKKHLVEKTASVEKLVEASTTPCPTCGKMMNIKYGRMGKFLVCSDAECKTTKPMPEEEATIRGLEEKTKGEKCPICGGPMAVKRGRFGYFLGCAKYPECKGIMKILDKTGFKGPACRQTGRNPVGDIVIKKSRGRGKVFYACSRWPDCEFIVNKKPESEAELQEALANQK